MHLEQVRQFFLSFFEKRGHTIVPSSSLIPTDPSVLFTTAGMQQFKPYFLGEKSPWGSNVASCQKCFRTSDIDEVGDETHLTFFEMLGNFSFGGYYKKEAIRLAWEFLNEILGDKLKMKNEKLKMTVKNSKLLITVFGGDKEVPADEESYRIWRDEIGIPEYLIKRCGRKDNFWGPTGDEGPCGPTTEIYFNGLEFWNLVFNEYYQNREGKLTPLKQKGVDTGMGLERLAMIVQNKPSIFETDLFEPIITELEKMTSIKKIKGSSSFDRLFEPAIALEIDKEKVFQELSSLRSWRIIADHIKASVFLASEGILPSNVERGYVLRRLLRRVIILGKKLELADNFMFSAAQKVIDIYSQIYPELSLRQPVLLTIIQHEKEKFEQTITQGMRQFEKIAAKGDITGENAFHLYDTHGFPLELTEELARERGLSVDQESFQRAFERHQKVSATGREKKFGGHGLILDTGEIKAASEQELKRVIRLHTATHLLQAALRQVLGQEVHQAGSDITAERLRFDFTFPRKLTSEELAAVERLVQGKVADDLRVTMEEKSFEDAISEGALIVPTARYPSKVKVYSMNGFSKEVCGGPHVERTKEVGNFRILKEESVAAGIRRIRAIVD